MAAKQSLTKEQLLAKAEGPSGEAMRLHPYYRGKVETTLKVPVRDMGDFAIWYTPGVAASCRAIAEQPDLVYEHTNKWNTVAVVSDGTRVLGLGDIGPKAGLPVMEGKALLYKYLGGVDGVPIMLGTKDPDEIIMAVKWLQPGFGGVNLEDLSQPKCFRILDTLRAEAEIPVWHDDQQGTATVVLAGLFGALKVVGKRIEDISVAFIGSGASNVASARLIFNAGVDPRNCFMVDSKGILGVHRKDLRAKRTTFVDKWRLCTTTNMEKREGGIEEAMRNVDVVIALATPDPDTIRPDWIKAMASDPVVFACANPVPEIWPWDAKEAGAVVVATGRSDFPNQANNSLGFPGIFRGALDVQATTITDEMCIAAAQELATIAEEQGIEPDHILPTMEDWEVFPREAVAVGMKAQEQGVALLKMDKHTLYETAEATIRRAREATQLLYDNAFIPHVPEAGKEEMAHV